VTLPMLEAEQDSLELRSPKLRDKAPPYVRKEIKTFSYEKWSREVFCKKKRGD